MIFLRHIWRNAKKSPFQPIIILLTLTFSVAAFLTAVKMCVNVTLEANANKHVDDSMSDISIYPSDTDDVRMLFVKDAEEVVCDLGEVLGEFNFTALVNEGGDDELIDVSASDLLSADEFYRFKFVEYGEFSERNINDSVIISSDLARERGLGIGDKLTILLLNERMTFTVQAVALNKGFMREFQAVVNIDSITDAIAKANPAISSFAGSEIPYTALKIRLDDKAHIDEMIRLFSADERFADKNVIKEAENVGSVDFLYLLAVLFVVICAGIVTALASITILTSLELLNKQRIKESALFMISGASPGQLNRILYLECLIYSGLAALLGILLSIPMNRAVNSIFVWETDKLAFRLYDIPLALISAPLIVLMTAMVHTARAKKLSISERLEDNMENKAVGSPYLAALIIFAAMAVFSAASLFFAPKDRYLLLLPVFVALFAFIYTFVPFFVEKASRFLIRLVEKRKCIPAKTILTLKNASVSYPIKHTVRLITTFLTLLFTAMFCMRALTTEIETLNTLVDADYISIVNSENTDELLEEFPEVEDTFRFVIVQELVTKEHTGVLGISADDDAIDYLNPELSPKKLPQGNEIVLSSGIAHLEQKKVGDSISFFYNTKKYDFTITEIIKSSANLVFFDAESIGLENKFLCIKTSTERNSEEYRKIANFLETRGAATVELEVIFSPVSSRIVSYTKLLGAILVIGVFTTTLGIINVLVSAEISRRRERAVYYTVGMSKRDVRRTKLLEVGYMLFISALLVPIFAFAGVLIVDVGMNSFGLDVFYI